MKILVIDSFFQPRDPAQADMYLLMAEYHELITDGDIISHLIKQDYDLLWLGIYHHRLPIDLYQVLFLNTRPVIIDQADNEEFIKTDIKYTINNPITVLSRYLPHDKLKKYCTKKGYDLKYLPWYVNANRVTLENKTCDVAFMCSMYGKRETMRDEIAALCKYNNYTSVIGEYFGSQYLELLAKCRYMIIECDRKCLTQKYIEAALCNTAIIGDKPISPANELIIHTLDEIHTTHEADLKYNREYVLTTFCNKDFFTNHLNKII